MAELYIPDLIGAMERGYKSGQERRRTRTLAQNYMGATQGDQNALAQVYGVDPDAGMQAQTFGLQQRRAQRQEADDDIIRAAKFYQQTKDPRAWAYLHQKFSSDSRFPPMPATIESPEDQEGSLQFANALISSMGGGGEGQNVQSRFINDRGEMVALMRDGSTRVVGKADPSMQIIEGEGGFYGVNRRNLNAAPVQIGGGAQAPAQPMPTASNGANYTADDATVAGLEAEIGRPLTQEERRQVATGTFNMQIPVGGSAPPPQAYAQTGGQLRPRDPVQDAISKRMAEAQIEAQTGAEIERAKIYGRQSGEAQANAQFGSEEARKAAREASTKLPQLQNAVRGLGRIRTALEGVSSGGLGLVDSGPLDQFVTRYTPAGRELEAAVGGIQNSVLALTRVPGVGSQSDLEARVAALQYPSLDNPPEVNARTLQNLEAFLQDLQAAYENVIASGNRQPAPSDYQQPRPTPQQAPAAGPRQASPVRVNSAADYESLPSGAEYIAPDGTRRRKR